MLENVASKVSRAAILDRNAMALSTRAKIVGVSTSTPPTVYHQKEMLKSYACPNRRVASVFLNGGIERRSLSLPAASPDGTRPVETQGELIRKHKRVGSTLGSQSLLACLERIGAGVRDVQHLCCVSTTGLLTPGFSALLCHDLSMRHDCSRLDVVGMGCNAGLNGMNAVAAWAQNNPGRLAVMVCIEVCSAAYVWDDTIETAVVNSLFGDGAATIAVVADSKRPMDGPAIVRFNSCLIPEALNAMRFDWDEGQGKFRFFLDRDVPYVIGAHAEQAVDHLLDGTNLRRSDINHWIIHAGGKKVIDAMKINLGLTEHQLRHTSGVLRDHGNVSSGSFLFSFERLVLEGVVHAGDRGVMITMGPGSTIEAALLQW